MLFSSRVDYILKAIQLLDRFDFTWPPDFSIQGSSGPYMRRAMNQLLPGTVSSRLFYYTSGASGAK